MKDFLNTDELYFSLIVTTQGNRIDEFKRFLNSLDTQIYKKFELIIVDQSENQLENCIREHNYKINYINIGHTLSLSKARNIGLVEASGQIVAFPDDDCWYPDNLLMNVKDYFNTRNVDVVCCRAIDPIKKRGLLSQEAKKEIVTINSKNALKYPMSIGIFSRFNRSIKFNEQLGVGTKWSAGEETDYLLQLLKIGFKIEYTKRIVVYHPYHESVSLEQINKYYRYGQGYGALIKTALGRKQYGVLIELFIVLFRSMGGIIVYKISNNKKYLLYYNRVKGVINGIIEA